MAERGFRLFPVVIALIVGAVAADAARRALQPSARRGAEPERTAVGAVSGTVLERAAPRPLPPAPGPARALESDGEARRRAATWGRIRREGEGTYLLDMLRDSDSLIRRWPDARLAEPLRLAVARARVPGFSEEFVAAVTWAATRWNGALLPVRLQAGADTAHADIVLTWVERLDSNRTGRADLTWDQRGHVLRAEVFLATHSPEGRPLDTAQMTALALHELGHAIGLGHSTDEQDALFPVTRAVELSERDRRTARLLYRLPAGSLR